MAKYWSRNPPLTILDVEYLSYCDTETKLSKFKQICGTIHRTAKCKTRERKLN